MPRRGAAVEWVVNDGRNDADHPLYIADTQSVESLNVVLKKGHLGIKRPGSVDVPLIYNSTGLPFTDAIAHLARLLPAPDLKTVVLIVVAGSGQIFFVPVGSPGNAAVLVPMDDAMASNAAFVTTAQLNGKLFIAYDSDVNRLHVWDPNDALNHIRGVGLPIPAAPTAADAGTGTYPAVLRYYRVAWRVIFATAIKRQSELGAAVSITPSGTGASIRVTRPAAPVATELVTSWVLYGSPDDEVYYELAVRDIGITTYDDAELVGQYNQHPAAPIDGSNFPFPSVKFLATDGTRLFGFGQWETAPGDSVTVQHGTAYWTPPQGSSEIDNTVGVGDDERIQSTVFQSDYLPLSVLAGSVDRGVTGPFYNAMYFFQDRGIYKLVATDDALAPFRRVTVTRHFGSVSHWSQVIGEDESGNECLYFLDPHDGPRRIVAGDGVQWIGEDVSTFWRSVNLEASVVVAHGVYDRTEKQVKWWVAVGSEQAPTTSMIVHHVTLGRTMARADSIRNGWAKWTGKLATAYTSLMFPIKLEGIAGRPIAECAYTGNELGLHRQDGSLVTDSGTPYQAYVLSKAWAWGLMVRRKRILDAFVTSESASLGTFIRQTIIKDFGTEAFPQDVLIETPLDTHATHLRVNVQGCDIADGLCDQVQLGDVGPTANAWMLCRWDALVDAEDAR